MANLRKVNFTIMNNILTKMFYIKLFQWNLQSVAESMTGTAAEEAIAEAGGPGPAYQGGQQVRI